MRSNRFPYLNKDLGLDIIYENKRKLDLVLSKPSKRLKARVRKYKITVDQYSKMLLKQRYRCKICKMKQSELARKLCIDHCHKTDAVRGLICHDCNFVIGFARDDVNILREAINYLTASKNTA